MTRRQANYRHDEKHLYVPGTEPHILDVPPMWFAMVEGSGDPNGPDFALAVEALYSFSYAVKMSYKRADTPAAYEPYTVYPLEGVWDLVDRSKPASDKQNLKYTVMIRQPAFLTPELFREFLEWTQGRKDNPHLERLRFEAMTDGLSCQALHLGPFEDEPTTFALMEAHCESSGARRASKLHREIYLSDPRRTEPARLKTVLRFQVTQPG